MANKFQVKRTSISGRTPNTTNSGNTHFIDTGELALNLTDGKMFSSNGSVSFEIGANLENIRVSTSANLNQVQLANVVVSNTVTINNDKELAFKTLSGAKARMVLQSDDNLVLYNTDTTGSARVVFAMYANSSTSNLQIHAPLQPLSGFVANGSVGSAGQTLTSNGTGVYWAAGAGTGTVTQVNTGSGLTGGPVTGTGTISVVANSGIIANATGLYVNSSYIATLAANSTTYLGGNTALDLRNYTDTQASAAYTNATTFAANASNISSGTLNASRLPATAVQNTDSRTLSGNLVISGTYFNPSANTILLGNSTQRWVLSANTGSFSGAVSGITTLATGNTTVTGFVNATSTIQGGSSLTIAGALSGVTTAAMGNTTVTGFVNATSTIQGGSSLTIAGALSGVTTAAIGNTTITGFANATISVNSALLTVGSSFSANSTVVTTSDQIISTRTGSATDADGQIFLNGGTSNRIDWAATGLGLPSVTTRSSGTKLVLYPAVALTSVDFGMGIDTNVMWSSVADTGDTFKWYANTSEILSSNTSGVTIGSGGIFPTSNSTATSLGSATQRWVLNANTGSFAGAVSGITTLATGNTTVTGFANVSTSVNSALLTVGTSFIANTTGAYHTGLVNAASINIGGSGFIANSTAIVLAEPVTANGTTGTSGQVLTSNGTTGSPYWTTVSAGLSIGGSNTQVQFNDSGALGGDSLFTYNNSTETLSVGNNTVGSLVLGVASPSTTRGIQQDKIYTADASVIGYYSNTLFNNATLTAARTISSIQTFTVANTQDANSTGGILGSDAYGHLNYVYNGSAAASNARINNIVGVYNDIRNQAGGATANTVDNMYGSRALLRTYSSGNITDAFGHHTLICPANNSVSGTIFNAYGFWANITSNTAGSISNAYLYYGGFNGTNFTGAAKFGIYITGESNNYVSGNFAIGGNASAIIFRATSDERLKSNIEIIDNPVEKIKSIRGVNFTYTVSNTQSIGVIAQDVEQLMPELVDINSEGYRQVNYNGIIGVLIEAVKQQQKEIDSLKQIIEQL